MFEMLVNPKKAERYPWELFFVGAFYASLAVLLTEAVFSRDLVLSRYAGLLIVTFTVMFSMPFMYYTIKYEESKIPYIRGTVNLLREHEKAIKAFLYLFLGFVVAFAFWYIVLDSPQNFKAQIETYCLINRPSNIENCVEQYGIQDSVVATGGVTSSARLMQIFKNNISVLIFTLVFSLIFGAGVIFILAWNASVIAAAIGIFTKFTLVDLPFGLMRYMIHGIPEIGAYFIVALAGGMVSIAIIKHEAGQERFWEVLHDSFNLIIAAVIVLFIAALMEVYLTPLLF
ncbi:stage II sporulation protein M [Candidatus Pacearchaeota archaeon]|nr:stage II sporulation protein M [Candidatus Pacearchaeota archaeon]